MNAATDLRQSRGLALAKSTRIKNVNGALWIVPSATHSGTYVVDANAQTCTCPDHEDRRVRCKHQWAVSFVRHEVVEADGSKVVRETLSVTYRQDWPRYNKAQVYEKEHVGVLLKSLCAGIEQPVKANLRGRPRLPLADVVHGALLKTFGGLSGRRSSSDLRDCHAKGLVSVAPHYNSIFSYLERPEIQPLLTSLVEETAAPLKRIEKDFATDSTGFATSTYYRWFDAKYGEEKSEKRWVKLHANVGVITNVIAAAKVTAGNDADAPELPALIEATAKRFNVAEVSADKAYLSHKNLAAIEKVGAKPFIPFKINSQADGSAAWERMHAYFTLNKDVFLRCYHKRSNVETTFFMIKKKFGSAVRAKGETAQMNEVLCKVVCHNLSVLTHAFYELGIEASFWEPSVSGETAQ